MEVRHLYRPDPDRSGLDHSSRGLRMTSTTVTVDVSYGQISVFVSTLRQPFDDWTDRHFAQGFAWRPRSVSFRALVEAEPHSVEIEIADHAGPLSVDAVRVTEVPFEVPANGVIEVASISDSVLLSLPAGRFLLRCELSGPKTIVASECILSLHGKTPHISPSFSQTKICR